MEKLAPSRVQVRAPGKSTGGPPSMGLAKKMSTRSAHQGQRKESPTPVLDPAEIQHGSWPSSGALNVTWGGGGPTLLHVSVPIMFRRWR